MANLPQEIINIILSFVESPQTNKNNEIYD